MQASFLLETGSAFDFLWMNLMLSSSQCYKLTGQTALLGNIFPEPVNQK